MQSSACFDAKDRSTRVRLLNKVVGHRLVNRAIMMSRSNLVPLEAASQLYIGLQSAPKSDIVRYGVVAADRPVGDASPAFMYS